MGRNFSYAICALTYLFGGTVSMLLSANLPVVVRELSAPTSGELELANTGAFLNASFLYGWMLGGLLLGVVCDRIGRIKTLALATGLYGLFTCLVYAAPDWHVLLVYRFLAGFGVGGVLLVSTVYISEIWPAENRSVMLGILAVMFPVGIVLSGALTAGFSHWRQAFLLGLIPLALAVVIFFFLPESKVWQTTKETQTRERSIWPLLGAPEYRRNLVLGSIVYGAVLIGLWGLFSWIPTWVQELVKGATDGQKERGLSMMLLGLGGIAGGLVSGMLMQRWGSRTTLLLTFTGLIGTCALLFHTNQGFSPIIYVEMAVLAMFFGISQGALSGYVPALFPAEIRATATGVCFNICRFFTATAVFFVGTLVEMLGGFGNALLTFALAFVIALFAAWYSPETEIHS
ncbi:MAG: MFS transporter [Saprospiraceae bacterium]|nr:MFS transporter [Saprospiraceae bacterium]